MIPPPVVSIIIPNFNKATFIAESIRSVLEQDFKDWEAIIVDDGSTDNSVEIINKLVSNDSRLKLFQRNRSPKGGSTCRNIGIENARGAYLFFFDSDDLMTKDCIGERINLIQANPTLDFAVFPVGTFYKAIGDSTMVWRTKKGDHLKQFLRHDLPWHTMSPLWRTSFVKNTLHGFDESFPRLQDVEFHTRAMLQKGLAYKIVNNTSPKCFYRIDHERTKQSQAQGLQTMYQGVKQYISSFDKQIRNPTLKRNLRGTLFSYLTQVNYSLSNKSIQKKECDQIIASITEFTESCPIFTKSSRKLLNWYNNMYALGFYNIKGFNYLYKKIFQLKFKLH
ncbi:glycosyltransferase family 2 protein [Geofilum rubicundum]|uniref:Glycosyltransferase, group 2 family protein n=1 Tax=Geofilum rubicundum JCM 15548 TaxID=1236989 RepID=A0A0E9LZ74_9BACT|nr:glycosyltransferase family 2 protein [Geofilum rubicundum]GAO30421.1 glycosyltransferase, group 2 family protein [Geofilum rubicundum JCM 15548]